MRRQLPLVMILLVGALGSARAQVCSLDARISYDVWRVGGNTMQGISIAWAAGGDWWNWYATASGRTWFTPAGGSATAVQSGYGSGWLQSGGWENPGAPHWANAFVSLEPRGNGLYAAEGWGSFACYIGGNYIWGFDTGHGMDPNASWSVMRPAITTPYGGYGQNHWAFWHLNGEPNIDGYVVSAQLVGNPNYEGVINSMTWDRVDKPAKVSLSPSSGSSTVTITSQAPSDGTVYDASVTFSIDGFKSDKLWIHINTPVSLYRWAVSENTPTNGCSGYETWVEYSGLDLWYYGLLRITTNEKHGVQTPGGNPPMVGWPPVADDVWVPSLWASDYRFVDKIWAYDCHDVWRPQPVPWQGLNSLVVSQPQCFKIGSATIDQGKLVQDGTQYWYTDHGDVVQ